MGVGADVPTDVVGHAVEVRCVVLILLAFVVAACGGGRASSPASSAPTAPAGTTAPNTQPPTTSAPAPRFTAVAAAIGPSRRAAMIRAGSWRPGCPVPIRDLR